MRNVNINCPQAWWYGGDRGEVPTGYGFLEDPVEPPSAMAQLMVAGIALALGFAVAMFVDKKASRIL